MNDCTPRRAPGSRLAFLRTLSLPLALAAILACIPLFPGGLFPRLELYFELDKAIADGEEYLAHTAHFPSRVALKKRFVRISGRLSGAEPLPERIEVRAELFDADDKLLQRLRMQLEPAPDGRFEAGAKIKKHFPQGSLMAVTLTPRGAELVASTGVTLCVELFKKKKDARRAPACGAPDSGGAAAFAEIQETIFTPRCASSGCHGTSNPQAGLVLAAGASYDNIVSVPSSQRPVLSRIAPGDSESSYLVQKIRGDSGIAGHRMPPPPHLTPDQIAMVVDWVNGGATR